MPTRLDLRQKRLNGTVVPLDSLACRQADRLYAIRQEFFTPVPRPRFENDLREKEWIILLSDPRGEIQGYSTLMRIESEYGGQRVVALFSGETIIHRDFWGQAELPRVWGKHVMNLARSEPCSRLYWLLTTSSYRTYRFLPLFFREFHPRRDRPAPPEIKGLIDHLGIQFFGDAYCPFDGIVRLPGAAHLRADLAEAPPERLKDPDVAFFFRANPGWARGEELACLAEISPQNLSPAGMRVARAGEQQTISWREASALSRATLDTKGSPSDGDSHAIWRCRSFEGVLPATSVVP